MQLNKEKQRASKSTFKNFMKMSNRKATVKRAPYKFTLLAGALVLLQSFAFGQSRPNIVIIFADDLGIESTGAYGAPNNLVQTPAIDGLAEEGRKFLNAYAPASLCSPSRYGLLAGEYYWRNVREWGIIQGSDPNVLPREKNLAARLKGAGYNTAFIGKWHLGYDNSGMVGGSEVVGFDHNYDYRTNINDNNQTRTAEFTDNDARAWIDAQSAETPFFLYFAPIAVHTPIIPGVKYQGTSGAGAYGDYINELDGSVENILNALDRNGFANNTLVIFASDNGAASGSAKSNGSGDLQVNGDYRGTKLTIFDAGFRVPLIVKWPGYVPKGSTSNHDVNLVDIYASIMDMLNLEMSAPSEEAGDSFSFFKAWFSDSHQPARENMILTSYEGISSVYTDRWKYIDGIPREPEPYDFFNTNRQNQEALEQLYNIRIDPNETNNLINTETAKAAELKALLASLRQAGYHSRTESSGEVNTPPKVQNPIEDLVLIKGFESQTIDISNVFTDEDGDQLSFIWASGNEAIVTLTESNGELTIHEESELGETRLTLTANDGKGGVKLEDFIVKIERGPNMAPIVNNPIEDQILAEGFGSKTIDITNVFSDEDGDQLSFSWHVENETIVSITQSNNILTIKEEGIQGQTLVSLTANDGYDGVVSDSFIVKVEKALALSLIDISEDFRLYPNPANKGDLYLELTNSYKGEVIYSISDLSGKRVFTGEIIKTNRALQMEIDTRHLGNGIYFISVDAGKNISRKFLIDR